MTLKRLHFVTPFAGVWIEIAPAEYSDRKIPSLPSRECGLKSSVCTAFTASALSLPSRECGLKSSFKSFSVKCPRSLPSRECGLKY